MSNCIQILICTILSMSEPQWKASIISQEICADNNLDHSLILAVMTHESRMTHFKSPNRTHDYGIMQLHCPPDKYIPWCRTCDVTKLRCNIRAGLDLMSRLKRKCSRRPSLCKPHWIQMYNQRSKGYARRVLKIREGIRETIRTCRER